MTKRRIYGLVCGNLIETKRRFGANEVDVDKQSVSNYNKYLQVDEICKRLGWRKSEDYVNMLSKEGFNLNFEYDQKVSPLGKIIAEHTSVNTDGTTDIVRLILFVKKAIIPISSHDDNK